MVDIRRSAAGPRVRLADEELHLLTRLVDDIDLLLASNTDDEEAPGALPSETVASEAAAQHKTEPVDPLVDLTGLDWPSGEYVEAPEDPALRRLLPDAYPEDAEASSEFRRYTENTLRGAKRADATVVRQGLASIAVMGERVLDDEQTQAWLRFLTDARLVLASRLGIEKAADLDAFERLRRDDPRLMVYTVYEWLLAVLGDLLEAIGER